MTSPMLLTLLLLGCVLAFGLAGPWLLRRGTPILARLPRLAIALIVGSTVTWLAALLALGPILAWLGAGPALLPAPYAMVCQRCLEASNPFVHSAIETGIPAILLLLLPPLLTAALVAGVVRQVRRDRRDVQDATGALLHGARQRRLLGYELWLVPSALQFALALPGRLGGIVLSTATVASLDQDELRAVLAHEQAHLQQRHHLWLTLMGGLGSCLRWVPFFRAATTALPHYLEIAADQQARRVVDTSTVVRALMKISHAGPGPDLPQVALAATVPPTSGTSSPAAGSREGLGSLRIRTLVSAGGPRPGGTWSTLAITGSLAIFALVVAAVHVPYAVAALTGCLS